MSRVSCVLLAGKSSEIKSLPAVLEVLNIPFEEMITVIGPESEYLARELRDLPLKVVYNADFAIGRHGSIRTGLSHIRKYYDGVFICHGDQPDWDAEVMAEMIRLFDGHGGKKIVYPTVQGKHMATFLVPREFVPEILQHEDDRDTDCSYLLSKYPARLAGFEIPESQESLDINSTEDFSMLMVAQHG